jgi:hypothetical protein
MLPKTLPRRKISTVSCVSEALCSLAPSRGDRDENAT